MNCPLITTSSLLFVPGDDNRKLEHAARLGADALVVDWEDSVLPERKQAARECCGVMERFQQSGITLFIRVNSFHSEWFEDDVAGVSAIRPHGIVLPKCESREEVRRLVGALARADAGWPYVLCPMIESATGLLRVQQIATASERVFALGFGAQDFCLSLGMRITTDEPELLMARSTIVTVASAYGLAAIDSPSTELNDLQTVHKEARRSLELGFTAKFAIHPKHIPVISRAFLPKPEEVKNAEQIIQQARTHKKGAFAWRGEMIDEAKLKRARQIIEKSHGKTENL